MEISIKNKLGKTEKTLSLDNATPRDIKTRKIVEYPIKNVAFSKNTGEGIL